MRRVGASFFFTGVVASACSPKTTSGWSSVSSAAPGNVNTSYSLSLMHRGGGGSTFKQIRSYCDSVDKGYAMEEGKEGGGSLPQKKSDTVYVPRDLDKRLQVFLESPVDEYHLVAAILAPPRSGKTRCVFEAARKCEYKLSHMFNGVLTPLVQKMTGKPGREGTLQEFYECTRDVLQPKDFGLNGSKTLVHLDEIQVYQLGAAELLEDRDTKFSFAKAPPAMKFAALVHHLRQMLNSKDGAGRVVISGTAMNMKELMSLASNDKLQMIHIMPTGRDYVKEVAKLGRQFLGWADRILYPAQSRASFEFTGLNKVQKL